MLLLQPKDGQRDANELQWDRGNVDVRKNFLIILHVNVKPQIRVFWDFFQRLLSRHCQIKKVEEHRKRNDELHNSDEKAQLHKVDPALLPMAKVVLVIIVIEHETRMINV